MNSKTVPVIGIMVIVIGSAHTALGIVTWLSSGPDQRQENFWFTVFGVLAIAFGIAIAEHERVRGYPPVSVLVAIAVVMLFGVLALHPVSGFLSLLVPLGFGIWRRVRRHHRSGADASREPVVSS